MRNLFWGSILVLIGFLLLLDNLGFADFETIIHDFWPAILVVWGISLLLHTKVRPSASAALSSESEITSSDLIHQSSVFGNLDIKIQSDNFMGGSISTVFGDCNIDLTGATLAQGEHELRVHSALGSSLILVEKDAPISVNANSFFGELSFFSQRKGGIGTNVEMSTPSFTSNSNRLKIIVSKVFGDTRITS